TPRARRRRAAHALPAPRTPPHRPSPARADRSGPAVRSAQGAPAPPRLPAHAPAGGCARRHAPPAPIARAGRRQVLRVPRANYAARGPVSIGRLDNPLSPLPGGLCLGRGERAVLVVADRLLDLFAR